MSILNTDSWKEILPTVVSPSDINNLKSASYELRLGDEYYKTNSDKGTRVKIKKNEPIIIEPGQLAMLLTHETITLPNNLLAFISIKAGVKFRGLVNVSGFHVDPGFKGKLKFVVFNAGSSNVILDWQQPLFPMWLCTLNADTEAYEGRHGDQKSITSEDVYKMQGDVIAPNELNEKFRDLKKKISKLKIVWAAALTLSVAIFVGSTSKCADATLNSTNIQLTEKQASMGATIDILRGKIDGQSNTINLLQQKVDELQKNGSKTTSKLGALSK